MGRKTRTIQLCPILRPRLLCRGKGWKQYGQCEGGVRRKSWIMSHFFSIEQDWLSAAVPVGMSAKVSYKRGGERLALVIAAAAPCSLPDQFRI